MNIWFAQATYFNVFLILFTLGILPDWTASCRIDVFFFSRSWGHSIPAKGCFINFIIFHYIISYYIHYNWLVVLQTLCDVERRLHPEMWCIIQAFQGPCLKWPAQLLELQGLVTVESPRLSILSEILIIVKLFVAAEVNEFVVYLVGFIDWVLVHTEKLITSFSILYLVRRIPKYQSSSELLLIWMAMGQTFLNRICKSPERERRSVSGSHLYGWWLGVFCPTIHQQSYRVRAMIPFGGKIGQIYRSMNHQFFANQTSINHGRIVVSERLFVENSEKRCFRCAGSVSTWSFVSVTALLWQLAWNTSPWSASAGG